MTTAPAKRYLNLTYNNKNVAEELTSQLMDWTFIDNLSGQIDDLQLVLEDVADIWMKDWFPAKGSKITASIINAVPIDEKGTIQNFSTNIGGFEIDEIDGNSPCTVTIKASALPQSSSLKGEEKSRAWENVTPKKVIQDVANANKITLYYQSNEVDKIERVEQENEADLAFLNRFCNELGLCLKITNTSIVILDEERYERNSIKDTINRQPKPTDDIKVMTWSFKTSLTSIYRACTVKNYNAKKKIKVQATFTPTNPPSVGRTLTINATVKNKAEALKVAKKKLREANKNADTISLNVDSNNHIDAGDTYQLAGFGRMSGKYIVTQVSITEVNIQLSLRRCLEGY